MKRRLKRKDYSKTRSNYELKRRSKQWKRKKAYRKWLRKNFIYNTFQQQSKEFENHPAPENYSFIQNTNAVLKYFDEAIKMFEVKKNINFDISKIKNLTPDAIALHVSFIKKTSIVKNCLASGNYPDNPELNKLFTQSGFQRFVLTKGKKEKTDGNFLHRERHFKVEPVIAKNAALAGIKHTFGNEKPYEPLYDILIECMSNTNNHATMTTDKTYWWLYVYNDSKTGNTSYSFIDLGVGIFKSIELQDYYTTFIKNFFKGKFLITHMGLVDDLLAGKIQSRVDEDNEIRGKGIPQIVEHSRRRTFKEFYIISNDIKINLKTFEKEQLNYNFSGTFLYWEIQKTK
ncbi:hypothetical protein [Parafilimonas sp.]|uniref:hypothetical protein n=1 Tax=Parafilimonas sp. TaxID=1969739 RepID=UPI003F80355D